MATITQWAAEYRAAIREAEDAITDRSWEAQEAKAFVIQARDCAVDAGLWDDTAITIADREVADAERALSAANDWLRALVAMGVGGYAESALRTREAYAAEPTL